MKKYLPAYLAAMLTVMLWAMSYIWADRLLELEIPVEFFVPVRILLAGSLLFIINLCLKQNMRIRRQDVLKFILLSLCMPFIYFVAETYGLDFTESPTITSLIVATNPLFAMAAGMLIFKENFSKLNILGVIITLAGLWLVTYSRTTTGPLFWLGIGILFIAVISEVSQISFTKSLSAHYAPSVIVMYQFLFGAVLFLPLFFTKGISHFDAASYLSWKSLYPILALALLCSATAFTSWAFAIKQLGVARTSVFLAVVPLVTAVLSSLFGEDQLSALQWGGLAVGMVGIYLTQMQAKARKQVPFNDFMTLARDRYSCRSFKNTPLTEEQIQQILEAARIAPTAANKQPVHVWVITKPEDLAKLKGATNYTYGAPAIFMVGCRKESAWVRKYDGKNGAEVDAAIVGTHIMLAASSLGLGNVWVGSFDPAVVKDAFPETADYEVVALFPVGTAAIPFSPNHGKRKFPEEFSTIL